MFANKYKDKLTFFTVQGQTRPNQCQLTQNIASKEKPHGFTEINSP